ncbi:AraC family transcriptional regulator [Paenibacillus eucommiae]|uniref:AraC family L-rhamnose operon regulatory protein RhaS n=1 Tax=Paenibacillus eucommiae TaxID=1355755 RepID=A0ABS4IXM9_9BACL|nr:AraC family transcriptional regulator [Paenibacillus eucommiae]MBP1991756.1 AraC family L-rhamnose operon regulatory protein RhaS [Paenibacillus eucommiae]
MEIKTLEICQMSGQFPFSIQRQIHNQGDMPLLHGHCFTELVYVVEGEGIHRFQDMEYEIRAGDIFVINPGEVHGYYLQPDQQIEIINCLFLPELIHEALFHELQISHSMDFFYVQPFISEGVRFNHCLNLHGKDADKVLYLLNGMQHELDGGRPGYEVCIRLQMIELMIHLSRILGDRQSGRTEHSNTQDLLIRRIVSYLKRYYNQKISIAMLCKLFHLSERQLNRQFNRYLACSVIDYVQQIRMEKAKQLLAETDEIIPSVANSVGYEDAAFFSTLFTRKIGCSPGKYRELNYRVWNEQKKSVPYGYTAP